MEDILNEAYGIVQCKECSWYKSCAMPMRFSAEDIRRQLESSVPVTNMPQAADISMQNLLSGMAASAQNSLLEGCPIFINKKGGWDGVNIILQSYLLVSIKQYREGTVVAFHKFPRRGGTPPYVHRQHYQ